MTEVRGDTAALEEDVWGDTGVDESILDGLDEEAEPGEEVVEDEEPEGEEAGEPEAEPEPTGEPREGTDSVLARLREQDPEAARVLSEMQRAMSQSINGYRDLQQQVLDLRERLIAQDEEAEPGEEPGAEAELPEGVTEESLEMFRQIADHLGYVPREELTEREQEQQADSYVQEQLRQGVETYGEDFGTVEPDGTVVLNDAVADRLERQLERLQDPKAGVTPLDLWKIEMFDTLLKDAGQGTQTKARARAPKARGVRQSAVRRRSAAGKRRVRIYDEERGDSTDDVLDRAWVLAKQNLMGA